MINANEARRIILSSLSPVSTEPCRLRDVLGRVLSEDVIARADIPAFDNSGMDGYAVSVSDIVSASS